MPIVVRLLHRPPHRYERHKYLESCMHTLRSRDVFHHRQRILLHRVDNLRSRPKDSGQRHCNHRPYLRSMPERAIFCCNESKRLHKLDHLQRYDGSGKQRRVYDSG